MTPEKLLDVYLGWLLSTDNDAGWHQPSTLQRMVEFKGDLPPPSGFDQADMKMIHEVQWLKNPHYLLPLAKEMSYLIPDKLLVPALYWRQYQDTCDKHGKRITEKQIADLLGITLRKYRYRREQAVEQIWSFLSEVEERKAG